jgi:UMF1 family MFS transporter
MKPNRRVENAWAMFDWANSAYNLVISTAIFPPYFISITKNYVDIFGSEVSNSALYAFAVTFSYAVIALTSPLLSGIADYGGMRMFFLKLFTTIGAASCLALFFFDGMSTMILGLVAFMLATIGHAGSLVFYNAYLHEIVDEDRVDHLSAKGYAWGYIGSVILLVVNLIVISKPEWFGLEEGTLPVRLAFLSVGIWWIGFAQITFKRMPKSKPMGQTDQLFTKGYAEIKKVWGELSSAVNTKRFLFAFFFYSAGVQTVIYLASAFAEKELNFATSELILIILILQLVAIGGAYFFAYISKITSNKSALTAMVVIWIGICIAAHFVETKVVFYIIAACVGLVLGGIQSLSRSTYSKLIPKETNDVTSYFSFYDVMYKTSIIAGTFSFGLVDQITGNMRYSILALCLFFVVGLVILRMVDFKAAKRIL